MVSREPRTKKSETNTAQHFVAYQKSDEWGPFGRVRKNQMRSWFTAKPFHEETLRGQRLWAFEGSGSPKSYRFVASGIISRLSDEERPDPWSGMGTRVHFRADTVSPIEVTNKP